MIYFVMFLIAAFGTSLHFVYELSHHNKHVAIFAAVNESTWEHIKICMTPTIIYGIYYALRYGINANYLMAISLCLLTIILLIPILFYTYISFTKKSILVIDVICFYITVITSQLVFNHFINSSLNEKSICLSIILLITEMLMYFSFTYHPFKNFIFKDPITKKYGLEGHPCHNDHHKH